MKDKLFLVGLLCAGALCASAEQPVDGGAAKANPPKPDWAAKRLAAVDTDGNGLVSLDEFKAMQAKREEERKQKLGDKYDAARAAKQPSAEERFKKLDKDGSGDLTKEEFLAPPVPPKAKGPKPDKPAREKKDKDPAAVNPAP